MRKTLSILFLCLSSSAFAADYFVATNGSDLASGNLAAPFATIQKAADVMGAGEACYIRGGTYHEAVVIDNLDGISGSPVTFTAYSNEVVTLDGSQSLADLGSTGWTLHSGNIYKTTLTTDIWQLYIDGELMIPARWPNGNFDDGSIWDWENRWAQGNEGASTNGVLVDAPHANADLAATGLDMTGAMAVLNVGSWKTWTRVVNSHSAGTNTFTYNSASSYKSVHHRYFLEGKLNLLDVEKEWFYDTATQTLYLQVPGGGVPAGDIRGKTQTYALDVTGSSYLNLKKLNFFGTTFKFYNSENVLIEGCDLLYPSCSMRMLGRIAAPLATTITQPGKADASNCTVRDCSFSFAESYAIFTDGDSNRVENCSFDNIDWVVSELPYLQAGIYMRGPNSVFSRNSINTAGASEFMEVGETPLVENCEFINYGLVQNDGAAIQYTIGAQPGSITRYNWFHDAIKYGARFDAPVGASYGGNSGTMHNNVGWNVPAALMLKGELHHCYNNTAFDTSANGIIILDNDALSNAGTITRNNAAEKLSGHRSNFETIPGTHDHNWNGYVTSLDIRTQLRDPDNLDFRLIAGSDIVDGGTNIAGITVGYLGAAPDMGAYEQGDSSYWIPGRKQALASAPVPPDMADGVKTDADLMWREGYQATSHNIYFGTEAGNLSMVGNQTNNIFNPGILAEGQTYYWRVDAVTPTGTVAGAEWQFWVEAGIAGSIAAFTPTDDAYVQDTTPDTNYGDSDQIKLITQIAYGYNREGYLKFNVNVPGIINSASLELYNSGGSHNVGVGVYSMTGTAWSQDTITWSNRPPINGSLLDAGNVNSGSWAMFEVSAAVASNGLVSFGLIRNPLDTQRSINTSETTNAPILTVSYIQPSPAYHYVQWADNFSISNAPGYYSDPDGDQLSNLAEYGLGGDPGNFNDALFPTFGNMNYAYRRRTDATERGLSYNLEECTNLVSNDWNIVYGLPVGVSPLEPGFEAVTNQIPATETNQFIRLRINIQ
ncbi:CBM96 family carbohydrate-binding protein [Pontiella sulfatireligans]|uniref:Right handed beta helix domain-containing protein n=1 Tax=Pontiella sulfatireligans TaxID=2750658 RepID=A0A6C2UHE8_9BACT|nr:DNRLRE domain-containing protein [Pontiella sulfatireligans]VGO19359.1 hypothetical protein SCARR_01417 [Pontiella sulfatireligans]